ncbi:Protein of unknown function (DUF3100) [Prauserella aidingensis]|uniref:DUF3100 domain-containing protein n=1 Tax=Prauserella aidingensis TaxID=387890 RepID=UPI0020A5F913|nr:DUF3100 domain-containing protein [Prauserella aidingensis]MCP2253532.1 Protein of unknown function (DUF3100) [Prauserella aidingensis]
MRAPGNVLDMWRLHVAVLVIALIAQLIDVREIPLGPAAILLLPLLYAFLLSVLLNPHVVGAVSKIVRKREVKAASPMIVITIMPFIAKFGTTIGPSFEELIEAGPALLLQEIGNLATVAIAFPLAVWVFKLRRESIGATFSVAREPNLAIIVDRYGLKSPEGTGVMVVYVVGTVFGTLIFSVLASLLASLGFFAPEALAMACGVGSGSMLAACSGALSGTWPGMEDTVVALSGASNLLTYATGLYVSLFVALPLVEWLYKKARPGEASAARKEN